MNVTDNGENLFPLIPGFMAFLPSDDDNVVGDGGASIIPLFSFFLLNKLNNH